MTSIDTKTQLHKESKKCLSFPTRYAFCLLAAAGNMLNFTLKVSLSVAIVAMVTPSYANTTAETKEALGDNHTNVTSQTGGGYDWSEMTQSTLLAGMQYGSLLSCLIGARLAEMFGPRLVSGPAFGVACVLHLMCPLVAPLGAIPFMALRVVQGLFVGPYGPGINALLLRWFPVQERGIAASIIFTAVNLGILFSMAMTGKICTDWGWPAVFYFYGGLGCVWTVLWMFFVYNSPALHPRITAPEREYILANAAPESKVTFPVPWIAIFTSPPVWAYMIVKCSAVFLLYVFLTELPTYMKNILNFDLDHAGYLSALPYVFSTVTNLAMGASSQWLRSKGYLSHLAAYKIFNAIGMLGPAVVMIAITQVEDVTTIIVLIILTMILQGGFFGGSIVNHLDLSPNFAATVTGLSDIATEAVSILAPTLVGAITNGQQTQARWQIVFYTSSAIVSLPYLVFFFFASVDEQSWNRPKEDLLKKPERKTTVTAA